MNKQPSAASAVDSKYAQYSNTANRKQILTHTMTFNDGTQLSKEISISPEPRNLETSSFYSKGSMSNGGHKIGGLARRRLSKMNTIFNQDFKKTQKSIQEENARLEKEVAM